MPNTLQELRLQRARIEAEIRAAESVDEKVGKVSAFIDEIGLGIEAAVAGLSERIRKKRSKRKWRYYQDPARRRSGGQRVLDLPGSRPNYRQVFPPKVCSSKIRRVSDCKPAS